MAIYADRVKETTTTTGTGTYSLGGAATGFLTFIAGVGSLSVVTYCAEDGTNWEIGEGTITSGTPDTLSRTTIIASSNAGSAVSWGAGTRNIFLTASAARVATTDKATTFSSTLSAAGNLVLTSIGQRIVADFSSATIANRAAFLTSTTNANTSVFALPNGTATSSAFNCSNNTDPTNCSFGSFRIDGSTGVSISSSVTGTGSYLPILFTTSATTRMTITAGGNVNMTNYTQLGSSAPSIQMKKLTGTTSSTQGGTAAIAHGLTATKILNVSVIVSNGAGARFIPEYTFNAGYQYSVWIHPTYIYVENSATNSVNITTKALSILITYEA